MNASPGNTSKAGKYVSWALDLLDLDSAPGRYRLALRRIRDRFRPYPALGFLVRHHVDDLRGLQLPLLLALNHRWPRDDLEPIRNRAAIPPAESPVPLSVSVSWSER
jgi:hypothetical protein